MRLNGCGAESPPLQVFRRLPRQDFLFETYSFAIPRVGDYLEDFGITVKKVSWCYESNPTHNQFGEPNRLDLKHIRIDLDY